MSCPPASSSNAQGDRIVSEELPPLDANADSGAVKPSSVPERNSSFRSHTSYHPVSGNNSQEDKIISEEPFSLDSDAEAEVVPVKPSTTPAGDNSFPARIPSPPRNDSNHAEGDKIVSRKPTLLDTDAEPGVVPVKPSVVPERDNSFLTRISNPPASQEDKVISEKPSLLNTNAESGDVKPGAILEGDNSPLSNPRTVVPPLVIIVHITLLILMWVFLGITTQRPVALPSHLVAKIDNNMTDVIWVVTQISDTIAKLSKTLFAYAVHYSLARYLAEPTSLFAVSSAIGFARGASLLVATPWTWKIISLFSKVALFTQTAGWNSLITPKRITVTASMSGFELDLASPGFQSILANADAVLSFSDYPDVIPSIQFSGSVAAGAQVGQPGVLAFNLMSYVNSTYGILPVNYGDMYDAGDPADLISVLPANVVLAPLPERPPGFANTFTMSQQGFTANVTCEQRPPGSANSPDVALVKSVETVFDSSFEIAMLSAICPGATNATTSSVALGVPNGRTDPPELSAVFAVSCAIREGDSQRWDLIITGTGAYKGLNTTVCSVAPYTTHLKVRYDATTSFFNSSYPSFITATDVQHVSMQEAPWLGDHVISTLLSNIASSQTFYANAMGDTINAYLANQPVERFNDILEGYIRGVFEFSVTWLRMAYTEEENGLYPGNTSVIPEDMRRSVNGTFSADTIGWYLDGIKSVDIGQMLAPSVVMLGSIVIILVTMFGRRGKKEPLANHYFDPGNILHLVAASSAGGLKEPLPPFNVESEKKAQEIRVALGPVEPHGRTGFVQIDANQKESED